MFKYPAAAIIWLYQHTFSPDHGPLRIFFPHGYCRFSPTCSNYTKKAILKHGLLQGFFYGIKRILRCHPWSPGGVDPVPER